MQEDRLQTAQGWTLAMSRWKAAIIFAAVEAVVGVAILALPGPGGYGGIVMVGIAVYLAFNAGQMKVEHDRIHGRQMVLGKRRPPGV